MERSDFRNICIVNAIVLSCCLLMGLLTNGAVSTVINSMPLPTSTTIVIDPGHGGEDGGAVALSGVYESTINLEIARRINDLLQILGLQTVMTRTTDRSIYISGDTLAEKKVSDLKERAKMINQLESAILVSIHQNYFSQSQYRGAQVFYGHGSESKMLAQMIQSRICTTIDNDNRRNIKSGSNIYLLNNIDCPGVLIECGFISNPQEDALLRNHEYQKQLSTVIASSIYAYCYENMIS